MVRPESARAEAAVDEAAQGEAAQPEAGRGEAEGVVAPASASGQSGAADEEEGFSVEGLGLADLLAGALAAYRGI